MLRIVEIAALALVASLPAGVALRVAEPAPSVALTQRDPASPQPAQAMAASAQGPQAGAVTISRARDGMFYAHALVNGATVRFLVDTGASVVVLTEDDARAIGLDRAKATRGSSLRTVSGNVETRWTQLDLELAGRKLSAIDAAVIDAGPGVSLLGQNALANFDSITIRGDELVLQ